MWFSSCRKPRKLSCQLRTWQDAIRETPGPMALEPPPCGPTQPKCRQEAASGPSLPEGGAEGHDRPGCFSLGLWRQTQGSRRLGGLRPDPGACCPAPRVLGLPVGPPPTVMLASWAMEKAPWKGPLGHVSVAASLALWPGLWWLSCCLRASQTLLLLFLPVPAPVAAPTRAWARWSY